MNICQMNTLAPLAFFYDAGCTFDEDARVEVDGTADGDLAVSKKCVPGR